MPNQAFKPTALRSQLARLYRTMKSHFITPILIAALSACATAPQVQEKSAIQLQQLQVMFSNMRENTSWSVDGPLLWGYFFIDKNKDKLEVLASYLQTLGYRVVEIYPTDDRSKFVLHIEKIERHTPESLDRRNQEFYQLAEKYVIDSYDGMDVGPAS